MTFLLRLANYNDQKINIDILFSLTPIIWENRDEKDRWKIETLSEICGLIHNYIRSAPHLYKPETPQATESYLHM